MKASEIVARARSLADIPSSAFISHSDETNSLNEAYKDVYSKITDSSDDYFVTIVELDMGTATQRGDFEWAIGLPADCYKLRFVDYKDSGRWLNMDKFNIQNRNAPSARPRYRWSGDKLWVSGSSTMGLPAGVRVTYYPPPQTVTVPEDDIEYCPTLTSAQKQLVTNPQYLEQNGNDFFLYIYDSSVIYVESKSLGTRLALYTGSLSSFWFYAGYIYILSSGNLYKVATELLVSFSSLGSALATSVVCFNFSENLIFYSTATETFCITVYGVEQNVVVGSIVSPTINQVISTLA